MSRSGRRSAKKGRTQKPATAEEHSWSSARTLLLVGVALAAVSVVVVVVLQGAGVSSGSTPWSRLGTRDVHSLGFVEGDTERILFGHHDGLLASDDGGRNWDPLPIGRDAMSLSPAADGSIVIAGHLVFEQSHDGGQTWTPIAADLPSLDIHGFARSLIDPARMWAYLAEGGVYESTDGGQRWVKVMDGHILQLTATRDGGTDVLMGVDPFSGVVASSDGGRTWRPVSEPPTAPVISLAATPDGRVLVVGGPDGLYRSDDAGATWSHVLETPAVLATVASADGATIVAVTEDTLMYRSDDGGVTWPGPTDD